MKHSNRHGPWLPLIGACCLLLSGAVQAELADTVARIKSSVIVIGTNSKLRSPPFVMLGTGFAIGDGNLIATNSHVVPETPKQTGQEILAALVRNGNGTQLRTLTLLARDAEHDLALMRLSGPPLPPLPLRSSDSVREGQAIALTGFPIGAVLGFSPVTHRGIISSITSIAPPSGNARQLKDAAILRLRSGSFDIFQLDATAYPGNSGGPLYDAETGEVLGVVNMVFVKASKEAMLEKPSGISYAIPASHLIDLVSRTSSR